MKIKYFEVWYPVKEGSDIIVGCFQHESEAKKARNWMRKAYPALDYQIRENELEIFGRLDEFTYAKFGRSDPPSNY